MIDIDSRALLIGLGVGLPAGALYFAGLAWGMRRALRARHPAALLLASFVGRAALLLGLGLWLVRQAHPLWTLAGYALAFLAARTLAVRGARRGRPAGAAGQEGG